MTEIKEYDIVLCLFNEIGIVREIETKKIWGNMITVEIIKTNGAFNQLGDEVPYKPEYLTVAKTISF